jgi:ribosomal protein S2
MDGNEVDMIIDGNHRVQKAIQLGYDTIDAKLISLDNLPDEYKQVFS